MNDANEDDNDNNLDDKRTERGGRKEGREGEKFTELQNNSKPGVIARPPNMLMHYKDELSCR